MKYISVKQRMSLGFASAANFDELAGSNVFFLTSMGIVSGKLLREGKEEGPNQENSKSPEKITKEITKGLVNGVIGSFEEACLEEKEDFERPQKDGFLLLEDVKIFNGANISNESPSITAPTLVLFIDQIAGIFVRPVSPPISPADMPARMPAQE
jgi:hypothetical protein